MIDPTDVLNWDDVCFIDCETRSFADPSTVDASVTTTSVMRYAAQAFPIIITWAIGIDGPVRRWEWTNFACRPTAQDLPEELRSWGGYFAAWNSAFDRHILDPLLGAGLPAWIDMMAHAAYNNLPLGLDRAAKACGYAGKLSIGKSMIKLFCTSGGALPEDRPDDWKTFCEYADVDVLMMQNVAASTFPVPFAIWSEFWVSERINDRGLPIDLDMARGGAALADEYAAQTNSRVEEITDAALYSVRQYDAQRAWVWERVRGNPFVGEHMVVAQRAMENGETEYKLKMDRPIIEKMIAALNTLEERDGLTDDEWAVLQFLEEREYGASAAPAKFQKVLDMVVAAPGETIGILPGQYVFSGATQTGRFSSKGAQVHNMTNKAVGSIDEEEAACVYLMEEADVAR